MLAHFATLICLCGPANSALICATGNHLHGLAPKGQVCEILFDPKPIHAIENNNNNNNKRGPAGRLAVAGQYEDGMAPCQITVFGYISNLDVRPIFK